MKTILIPTDFSKNAYAALYYATQLFKEEECTFIIVHSFEFQVTHSTSRIDIGKTEAVVEELYNTTEAECEKIKNAIILETKNPKHTFSTIATSLALSRAINKLIVKESVDYVVMGSKGRTGASDILVGSNTLAMIRKIRKAPLLVIPKDFEFKPIKKIAFATGFKRAYVKDELQPLMYVSSLNDAIIKVVHVQKKGKKTEAQRANFHELFNILKEYKPENNYLSGEKDTYNAITSYLEEEQIELLAMIYYKHNVMVRLFREATVKDIAKYTVIPFLILPTMA